MRGYLVPGFLGGIIGAITSFLIVLLITWIFSPRSAFYGEPAGNPSRSNPSGFALNPSGEGRAPQNVEEAARVLGVDTPQYLTVLNGRPGDPTAIGWVLGTSASESAGVRVSARTVPAGVCVDYDPGASSLSGNFSRSERLTANWTRSLLSSQGAFNGLKATFYWTPCNFTTGGTIQEVPSGPGVGSKPPPQADQTRCSEVNPSTAVGGNWKYVSGNQWKLVGGAQTIKGAEGWVVHTPRHPANPGLNAGSSERTNVATAYNEQGCT